MTPYELYEKYKGRKGKYVYELDPDEEPSLGIIVGYCTDEMSRENTPLIMSVTSGYGWGHIGPSDFIIDGDENNSRYRYVNIRHIQIKFGH